MKKMYEKPMLYVESFKLDASVAGSVTCTADDEIAQQIMEAYNAYLATVGVSDNSATFEQFWKTYPQKPTGNTYCYHTAANSLFNS